MRLFAALPLSDEVTARLLRLRLRLSTPRDGLRWSTPEQWHLTLQFLGEVEPPAVDSLAASLEPLAGLVPSLEIDRLDLFAAKGILVANIAEDDRLSTLHRELRARAAQCGLEPDSRPFRPHITLARAKGKAGYKTLQRVSQPALPSIGGRLVWHPSHLQLLQSTLQPQGAEYQLVHAFPGDLMQSQVDLV